MFYGMRYEGTSPRNHLSRWSLVLNDLSLNYCLYAYFILYLTNKVRLSAYKFENFGF